MKKLLALILSIVLVTGCGMNKGETPSEVVEKYLSNYKTLNSDVIKQLDEVVDREVEFSEEQKVTYKEIIKNHYKELNYKLKDELIDGDNATVKAEIEVTDYSTILTEAEAYKGTNPDEFNDEDGLYDIKKYNDYRLDKIKNAKDKVKYTIDFTLTKDGNEWIINPLSDIDESKILGTYSN